MKATLLLLGAMLLSSAARATTAPTNPQVAESKLPHSSVSVAVDPKLDDGRLVIKIAAQNRTAAAVPFGPASVSISKLTGEVIALSSLQQLIDNVRVAAGMPTQAGPGQAPTAGAYATAPIQVDGAGHPDVSGYTGGSAVAPGEIVRRTNQPSPKSKPSIDRATAEAQIAALRQAILQDAAIQPGQVVAGELVSEKLKFGKGEDRTLRLIIRVAGDEHGFTIAAPVD